MAGCLKLVRSLSLSAIIALPLVACSTAPAVVQSGDRVDLSFTCRLPGGELAATTRPDSSVTSEPKSPVYLPRTGPDTVTVTAGPQPPDSMKRDRQPFEEEILQRLASRTPGLKQGERARLLLEAERYSVSSPTDKFVKLATVRKRQKEMRLSREEYTTRTGKAPEAEQPFVLDKMVPGKVSEVTEKEVVIRFSPVPGKDLATPFGKVTVREMADHYELAIAVEKGRLIRTGGMAGRISAVDKESFTIDYRHPFADEKLNCEVRVVKVEPRKGKDVSPPVPAPLQQGAAQASKSPVAQKLDSNTPKQSDEALRKLNDGKQTEPCTDTLENCRDASWLRAALQEAL